MKTAFIFPGQGSQYVGMGRDLYQNYPAAREALEKAAHTLDFDLTGLCFNGPEEELKKTFNAQPAILAVSIACFNVLREEGAVFNAAAGHSLGEYSALVAAGALAYEDAVRLVRIRGKLMQEAVPLGEGGMAAVLGLDVQRVQEVCRQASGAGVVEAVNLNCPGQVVIAGDNRGLQKAAELARGSGAKKVLPLSVSAPFHSSLMRRAGEKLGEEMALVNFLEPRIPVVSNVTAGYHGFPEEIKNLLMEQVYSPVRWQESIEFLIEGGVGLFVEVGPGRVLNGLVKKINRDVLTLNVEDGASLEKALATLKEVGKDVTRQ